MQRFLKSGSRVCHRFARGSHVTLDNSRWCSSATAAATAVGSVQLPSTPVEPSSALEAVRSLVAAASSNNVEPGRVFAQPPANAFLGDLGQACQGFEAEHVRQLLASFAAAQTMPSTLWAGGLSEEVPRAMEELPDLHTVHVALLLAALELRESGELLVEVAQQLESRAEDLPPAGLAGAAMALSQLGPWSSEPAPGGEIFKQVLESLPALNARELSATALAAATLGYDDPLFWQQVHGGLIALVNDLTPRQLADTLLALATHQRCPITLLEELQSRIHKLLSSMEAEEALSCTWTLCAMQLFHSGTLAKMLEIVMKSIPVAQLTPSEVNQLRQIALSLELESGAAKTKAALPEGLFETIRKLPSPTGGAEDPLKGNMAEAAKGEIGTMLAEAGAAFSVEVEVEDLYTIDIAAGKTALVLDGSTVSTAEVSQNPWTTLKCRHLKKMGWNVEWLPVRQWDCLSEEDKDAFVKRMMSD